MKFSAAEMKARRNRLADLVGYGMGVVDAGRAMGLTRGETAHAWRSIKKALGDQAR